MTPTEARLVDLVAEAWDATDTAPSEVVLTAGTRLPDVMDSVTLAVLIVLVEEEWAFEMDDELIEPAIFRTIGALAAFVEGSIRT
jgi:acyl carrier protein